MTRALSCHSDVESRHVWWQPRARRVRREDCPAVEERGASTVEMAIIVGVFLLFLFGIIEFGRFISAYAQVQTATREAARYGSAVGDSPNGVPRYTDCDEIRSAGQRITSVLGLTDADFSVTYDEGPGTTQSATCPAGSTIDPALVGVGDRVVVTVTKTFDSGMPLIDLFLDGITITSTDRRTIFKDAP